MVEQNQEKQLLSEPKLWRQTLADDYQCFINYTMSELEYEKEAKELKTMSFETDKLINENLTPQIDKYLPKSFVYHEKHGYLQIKKYDEEKKIYVCKVKKPEQEGDEMRKEQEEVEATQEEIS